MSKPFLVVNIVGGDLGAIHERDTWEDAVNTAVHLAAEQCGVSEDKIRNELEADSSFFYGRQTLKVYIAQADDE
jgi:hypothetical protein